MTFMHYYRYIDICLKIYASFSSTKKMREMIGWKCPTNHFPYFEEYAFITTSNLLANILHIFSNHRYMHKVNLKRMCESKVHKITKVYRKE